MDIRGKLIVKKMNSIQALIGVTLFAISLQVNAIPISGEIGMGGSFIAVDSSWVETGTASATGVDFDPNLFIVGNATGDFAGVGLFGSITDFQFDPSLGVNDGFGGVAAVTSITDFWTIDSFSFELTSVSRGFTNDPDSFLVLEGTGIISSSVSGLDATLGTWVFTGNTTGGGSFSWSAGSAAQVPEPGVLALLGIGLIGFAGRKKYIYRTSI
jgi:hypothetical protein